MRVKVSKKLSLTKSLLTITFITVILHKTMSKHSTYADKLKDPRWQRLRLEILERDGFKCRWCYSEDKTLHVHHKYYISGREPWQYPPEAYLTLCLDCHDLMKADGALEYRDWEAFSGAISEDNGVGLELAHDFAQHFLQMKESCGLNNTECLTILNAFMFQKILAKSEEKSL